MYIFIKIDIRSSNLSHGSHTWKLIKVELVYLKPRSRMEDFNQLKDFYYISMTTL